MVADGNFEIKVFTKGLQVVKSTKAYDVFLPEFSMG